MTPRPPDGSTGGDGGDGTGAPVRCMDRGHAVTRSRAHPVTRSCGHAFHHGRGAPRRDDRSAPRPRGGLRWRLRCWPRCSLHRPPPHSIPLPTGALWAILPAVTRSVFTGTDPWAAAPQFVGGRILDHPGPGGTWVFVDTVSHARAGPSRHQTDTYDGVSVHHRRRRRPLPKTDPHSEGTSGLLKALNPVTTRTKTLPTAI